ncbi:MAG: succinyl-CoA synthetase subunit alpha [Candidatus Acididesulfobacter diazotrophicus]|jgi:succinyl-CoA synthetase alpha subunit|uniref:Succinyl-CoA synthetase subunit alpha n=1 Tax=Candidatus Acididesulfobacter diazotrophicus TaxID=2597226 RepID=A0A519BNL0_9DELT|nr:MAG: succinyl-CoA synthetase subunit alpha [Candidatus Acididesulfobacter diazotrophicus]
MKGTKYLNDETGVIVIGITGREASQVVIESEKLYPGIVKCGVTPGKGGILNGALNVPVYDTVKEALAVPELKKTVNTGLIYVPPTSVLDAVMELINHDIKLMYIITEHVPIRDSIIIYEIAKSKGITIIGGTSLGCFVPSVGRIGAIGGKDPSIAFKDGSIVVLSKSGGLTVTTSEMIKRRGYGIYMALALGGDIISCTTFADVLPELEKDGNVNACVILGEPGGTYEEQVAELISKGGYTKPLAIFVSGIFQENMPDGVAFGHAGAIVERGMGKATDKINYLEEVGKKTGTIKVARFYHDLVNCLISLGVKRDFEDTSSDNVKPLYSTLKFAKY